MATTKKSVAFRISPQAEQHLNRISELTGMSKTAAVELAIVKLSETIKGDEMNKNFEQEWKDGWIARIEQLNLGYNPDLNALDGDTLKALYEELAAAQGAGQLDLETNAGVENLERIMTRYEQ